MLIDPAAGETGSESFAEDRHRQPAGPENGAPPRQGTADIATTGRFPADAPVAVRPWSGASRAGRASFPYRLLAVDLDGTVVRRDGHISRTTVQALACARERGALLVVATGRAYGSADVFARRLGAPGPVVACDGALVRDSGGGRVHLERALEPEAVAAICRAAEACGGAWAAFTHTERVVAPSARRRPLGLWRAARRVGWNLRRASLAVQVDRAHPLRSGPLRPDDVVLKLVAWAGEGRPRADLAAEIARRPVRLASGDGRHYEIVAAGVSKGHALGVLAESLGIRREEVLAFGDGTNDLEMLRYAGWGVAMRTAPGPVREAARAVTGSVDDDGVARALEALGVGAPARSPRGAGGGRLP